MKRELEVDIVGIHENERLRNTYTKDQCSKADISIKRTIDIDLTSKVSGSQVIKYYLSDDDVRYTVKNYISMNRSFLPSQNPM